MKGNKKTIPGVQEALMFRNERKGENGLNGKKSPEGWRFKLDAKRGPFESGKFGKNGKLAQTVKDGVALSRMWQIFKLDAKSDPFSTKMANQKKMPTSQKYAREFMYKRIPLKGKILLLY